MNGDAAREQRAFDLLFNTADTNGDGILTPAELLAVEPMYNTTSGPFGDLADINDGSQLNGMGSSGGSIAGTISDSFSTLIAVFGEQCDQITRASLEMVVLNRQVPASYSFPSPRSCGLNGEVFPPPVAAANVALSIS